MQRPTPVLPPPPRTHAHTRPHPNRDQDDGGGLSLRPLLLFLFQLRKGLEEVRRLGGFGALAAVEAVGPD